MYFRLVRMLYSIVTFTGVNMDGDRHGARPAGLDPEGMRDICVRCGADVSDAELVPDSLGNGYCRTCRELVDDDGRERGR